VLPAQAFLSACLDLLAPRVCPLCGAPSSTTCPHCLAALAPAPLRWVSESPVGAAARYGSPLSDALQRLKYGGRYDLGSALGRLLLPPAQELLTALGDERPPVLVPVPLHPTRLAERGYNQSLLLSRALASLQGWPCRPTWLRRVRDTNKQVGRNREQRLTALVGAFEARVAASDAHRLILVVDDVITTGATFEQCLGAFKRAGASRVAGLCVASTDTCD